MAKLVNKLVDSFEHDETPDVGCVRAVLAELVLTFLFVFTGVSAAMAAGTSYAHRAAVRIRRDARRRYADGDAGGGGYRARAGRWRPGHGRLPRLRRPPQPRRHGGAHGARPHHQAPGGAVRRRTAAGLLPRLHPPPLPQRRHGDPGARPGRGHQPDAGPGDGGDPHLLPALRHLRHDPGPTEPGPHHWPAADGPHRRRQQPCRWQLHRRVHEPSTVLWPGPGHRGLDKPLGLLDRPAARRAPGWFRVRVAVPGEQDTRAAAQWGHLTHQQPPVK